MNKDFNLRMFAANKLKNLRENNSMTQDELAEKLCQKLGETITRQTVSLYENGKRGLNQDILFALSDIFNVSINTFFPPLNFDNAEIIDIDPDIVKIPVYGTIKAGIPVECQSDIIDYIDIPKKWTRGNKEFYGLELSGDSMYPKYNDKDIVIFEKNCDVQAYNGKDVAVMINRTESTFKKIKVTEQGIILQPYNPDYDIMTFSKKQVEELPITVIGIARERRTKVE